MSAGGIKSACLQSCAMRCQNKLCNKLAKTRREYCSNSFASDAHLALFKLGCFKLGIKLQLKLISVYLYYMYIINKQNHLNLT